MIMRRVPIRMKLAAALAVPLLGLFAFTAIEVVETTQQASQVRAQTELARSGLGPAGVIATLQNERTWAVVDRVGMGPLIQAPVVGYEETRRATNEAIAAFRETVSGSSDVVREAYGPALTALTELTALRDMIDADTATPGIENATFANDVFLAYADVIAPFLQANGEVALAVDDGELRQLTWLANVTTVQVETLADLSRESVLSIVIGGGFEESSDIAPVATIRATFEAGNERLLEAGPPYDAIIDEHYPRDLVDGLADQIDAAIAGEDVDLPSLTEPLNVSPSSGYMGMRAELVRVLNERADELNAEAAARQRIYLLLAAVALAATVLLAWAVSRSITNPLRSLTRQAKAMADTELPDAVIGILDTPLGEDIDVPRPRSVVVQTRDEVSDVADALNTVQDTALDRAIEQAVLRRNIADSFVNLGRRNQNLLSRQLDFITELEGAETDADTLANLFRLDHLATRMRRNAESLLVLAGFAPSRQWAAPVRLADVIRAALSEVESYQRVVVEGVEPVGILGSATADLAHLLAELIENALVFSPPERQVRVHGRRDAGGEGYTLAIVDAGLGMTAGDLAAANRRLAGAESFTIAPSKYLGHYVAGNLAGRHGIRARLQPSRGTGVTAILELPESLLTAVPASGYTPAHGTPAISAPAPEDAAAPASPSPASVFDGVPQPPPYDAPAVRSSPFVDGPLPSPPYGTPVVPPAPVHRSGPPASPPFGTPAVRSTLFETGPPPSPPYGTPVVPPAPVQGDAPPLSPYGTPTVRSRPFAEGPPAAPPHGPGGSTPERGPIPVGPATPVGRRPVPPDPFTAVIRAPRPPRVVDTGETPAVPQPFDPGAGAAPPLTRRVRGAQAPNTNVVPLRGDAGAADPAAFDAAPRRAADMRALLADFTAGVQRGLDEARGGVPAARG
jgi:signal transduction histidine kinase